MAFQTEVHSKLVINGDTYLIGEHPFAPGVPYGQEGRQGTVYLLQTEDRRQKKAIKVFRSQLINPSTVHLSSKISKYSAMEGLAACERSTITPHNNPELLAKEPDLLYAVVMPWIDGPTWMDMVMNKQPLTRRQSYTAAYALAEIMATMEQRGLAHCDLSGPNLIMPMFSEGRNQVKSSNFVQLIDLEQMFSNQFEKPEYVPTGSPGYAPRYANNQMWNAQSDRFAGAILIMEMLGSCMGAFAQQAWGESYFDPKELQTHCERYDRLISTIRPIWGAGVTGLIQRAWESDELSQCPTFGEWLLELTKIDQSILREDATVSMPKREEPQPASAAAANRQQPAAMSSARRETAAAAAPKPQVPVGPGRPDMPSSPNQARFNQLMRKAKEHEGKGNLAKAIETYRNVQALGPHESVAKEIEIAIEYLQKQMNDKSKKKTKGATGGWLQKLLKLVITLAVIAGLGFGGYWVYGYFKGLAEAGPVPTKAEKKQINEEIQQLKIELAARDKTIKELTKEVEELRKPLDKRSGELIGKLMTEYEEIQKLAAVDPSTDMQLHEKMFKSTEAYMNHVKDYYKTAYNLDGLLLEQIGVVEGYYFPFIYNRDRNAQLNFKFYTDYKDKFAVGGY
ncbi:hypothetical protein ACFQZE_10810 [Paenibacillus sp. GCM10027627]|uniref:hypothetical protein n=1 Tax=unclassified Paenibacillus TaxID=185978 RepID=UPI0036383824